MVYHVVLSDIFFGWHPPCYLLNHVNSYVFIFKSPGSSSISGPSCFFSVSTTSPPRTGAAVPPVLIMKNTWDAGSGSSSADGATPVGEFLGCHHQFMGYTVNGNIHGIYIYIYHQLLDG